jgi:hypothetical protein
MSRVLLTITHTGVPSPRLIGESGHAGCRPRSLAACERMDKVGTRRHYLAVHLPLNLGAPVTQRARILDAQVSHLMLPVSEHLLLPQSLRLAWARAQ